MSEEPINNFKNEYRFLSNVYPVRVEMDGFVYPSVEHAYQAAKTTDLVGRKAISELPTAGEAKRAGQQLSLRPNWESIKIEVMRTLLKKKFASETDLAEKLLATGERQLIEGNHWNDCFWGVCNGRGENHLGKLLMIIRSDLNYE